MTSQYRITNRTSGADMGVYEGDDADLALLAMTREGGGETVEDYDDWSVEYVPTYALQEVEVEHLAPRDLRAEVEREGAEGYTAYRVIVYGEDGYERNGNAITLLYHEPSGRAGIAAGGPADWTDCDSPEDAVERWLGRDGKVMR